MASATSTPAPETDEEKRTRVLRESYAKATADLRETHLAEFNDLRVKHAAEQGIEWTPPLTAEEKAKAELERLLAEHPGLAEKVAALHPGAPSIEEIPAEVPEPIKG